MDPQSKTVDEVCLSPTSAFHRDTTLYNASARPEPTKGALKEDKVPASWIRCGRGTIEMIKAAPAPKLRISHPSSYSRTRDVEPDKESDEEPDEEPDIEPDEEPDIEPDEESDIKPDEESDIKPADEVWINIIRYYVNLAQPMDHLGGPCTIFEVPNHIRQLDDAAYGPVIASLGPFHHHRCQGAASVCSFMKDYKWQCVRHLLSRHRSRQHASQLLDKCWLELKKHDEKVRNCYSKIFSKLNAEEMALIMLLDGCFIIHLMLKFDQEGEKKGEGDCKGEREEDKGKKRGECMIELRGVEIVLNIEKDEQLEVPTVAGLFTSGLVLYDLLKLENQIPFFIIQLLFDRLIPCEDGQINLLDLALQLFKDIHPEESKSFKKKSPEEYHHLLHLFYSSRIPSEKPAKSTSAPGCIPELMKCKWKKAEVDPSRESPTSAPKWIPSATELNRAGVKFVGKKPKDSFLNIKFQKRKMKLTPLLCLWKLCLMLRSWRMEIPPLQIYDYTRPLFRNLIAFEQCYFDTEMYITIYALLMGCIIDQAEDVRLLHLKGILQHKLSNNQEVADLFNKLGSQIHYVWEKNYLANQIAEVDRFYEVKWHKRLASLRRDYFRNPWATISVLVASFLLFLAVGQAVFSVLKYFHGGH